MFQVDIATCKLSITNTVFLHCASWVTVCVRDPNLFCLFVLLFMLILHSASFQLSVLPNVVKTIAPSPAAARVVLRFFLLVAKNAHAPMNHYFFFIFIKAHTSAR